MGTLPIPPNPCRTAVPVVRWPDAILEGTAGGYPCDIKSVYSVGANYLMQGSDLRKSIRAFNRLELAVCHDCFLTPTARHCDVVLPASTSLERDDILLSGGNYLLYSGQAVPPPGEARTDYDIFCGLADRLGFLAEYSEGRSAGEWLQNFVAQSGIPDFQEFKRTGVFVAGDRERVGLADFAADPQRFPLSTPSGLVEISSAAYAALGASAVPRCRVLETTAEYPLRLITPHPRFRIHSQHDNLPWFRQQEKQALWIHPDDARERGIAQGQAVLVRSPEGAVRIAAHVTEEIMPGVVSLNEGVWPEFDANGVEVAGSANVLTSTVPTLPSGGTRTHSVLVRVERVPSLRVPSFELALPSQ
jgi:anaerobic selenocysteine-containing dehydrogenase